MINNSKDFQAKILEVVPNKQVFHIRFEVISGDPFIYDFFQSLDTGAKWRIIESALPKPELSRKRQMVFSVSSDSNNRTPQLGEMIGGSN